MNEPRFRIIKRSEDVTDVFYGDLELGQVTYSDMDVHRKEPYLVQFYFNVYPDCYKNEEDAIEAIKYWWWVYLREQMAYLLTFRDSVDPRYFEDVREETRG